MSWAGVSQSLDSPVVSSMFSPSAATPPSAPSTRKALALLSPSDNNNNHVVPSMAINNTPKAKATKVKYSPPKEMAEAMLWDTWEELANESEPAATTVPLGFPFSPQTPAGANEEDEVVDQAWTFWEGEIVDGSDEDAVMEVGLGAGLFFTYLFVVACTAAFIFFPDASAASPLLMTHKSLTLSAGACAEDRVRFYSLSDDVFQF